MAAVISGTNGVSPAAGAAPPKLERAAKQFEAMLLATLLGPMEQTFSAVPGGNRQPDSGSWQSLEVEALSQGLVAAGGLGISAMIARSLMKRQGEEGRLVSNHLAKVSPASSR